MIIGQLLEAARAASDAIKGLSQESRSTATALVAAAKTLEKVEEIVFELDDIIRTGTGDSLVTKVRVLQEEVFKLKHEVDVLEARVVVASKAIETLERDNTEARQRATHVTWAMSSITQLAGWTIVTLISLYAVFR